MRSHTQTERQVDQVTLITVITDIQNILPIFFFRSRQHNLTQFHMVVKSQLQGYSIP